MKNLKLKFNKLEYRNEVTGWQFEIYWPEIKYGFIGFDTCIRIGHKLDPKLHYKCFGFKLFGFGFAIALWTPIKTN
jgi:hypothetical protein